MNKSTELTWFKLWGFKRYRYNKSVTLIELLISMVIVGIMVLSFYSLETFGHQQVMSVGRRAKVQNNLAYALEHIGKYVQQANGDLSRKAIQYYPGPGAAGATGFSVYIDLRSSDDATNRLTPSVFTDDGRIDYTLSTNTLTATCTANGGTCPFTTEIVTDKIIAGVVGGSTLPASPTSGFYVLVDPLGNYVDIGLVGRYTPTAASARLTNPQIAMKTRLICNNAPTH
ncbi:MAG: prepilin-type N-terminal cleavage/methylation domain-containing protein [Candidatus Omnitrophica bacterium]|nr:prepilin-type N-terminal cleavage/methylation domain-containing protein [Candidatus Omnitrophota bacterium]